MAKQRARYGDIIRVEWLVMLGEKVLGTYATEHEAYANAERRGGSVKKIEWKKGGRL